MVQLQLRILSSPSRMQRIIQALRALMIPAQLDRGCGGCWLYLDAVDSGWLCYQEEWASATDLEREMRSARFTRLLSVMEQAPKAPSLEFRFISQTRGLEYVEVTRLVGETARLPANLEKEPPS